MRLNVCKEFVFDSAHHLPGYNGPCANLHGHQWKLEVEVSGEVDKLSGMVVDFVKMKKAVTEVIINKFDHHLINDIMPLPTAENMVMYMVPILQEIFDLGLLVSLERIRLYETPTSFCEWKRVTRGCDCGD